MDQQDDIEINSLTGEFLAGAEEWEGDPRAFSWDRLRLLAQKAAHAYNEGRGPSFHALALDGVAHNEYHFRFLQYSLQAGFDPFRLASSGTGSLPGPVINHEDLAEASLANPWSEQMRNLLFEEARRRFPQLTTADGAAGRVTEDELRIIGACAASIPRELLERVSADLLSAHPKRTSKQKVNATEGYLSPAEVAAESGVPIS
ncbi:MAG TPA: hypothetical protein VFF81_10825 [Noviherbaspirillum sp.]|nr:hypothetical protein [Noviherbaspirillum sp.]